VGVRGAIAPPGPEEKRKKREKRAFSAPHMGEGSWLKTSEYRHGVICGGRGSKIAQKPSYDIKRSLLCELARYMG